MVLLGKELNFTTEARSHRVLSESLHRILCVSESLWFHYSLNLAFYQISAELFGSLLNNPYLCTRNVIAVKFTDVKIYEEFL